MFKKNIAPASNIQGRKDKLANITKTSKKMVMTMLMLGVLTMVMAFPVFATDSTTPTTPDGWANSTIAAGVQNLIQDLSAWLTILAPITGAAFAVYYAIRRSAADETDGKMWTKRIVTSIICGVGAGLISGIITILSGYFS